MTMINFDSKYAAALAKLFQLLEVCEYANHFYDWDQCGLYHASAAPAHAGQKDENIQSSDFRYTLQRLLLNFLEREQFTPDEVDLLKAIDRHLGKPACEFSKEGELLIEVREAECSSYPLFYQISLDARFLDYRLN